MSRCKLQIPLKKKTSTLIPHEHKLTRCDSRDAETAEDEQHEPLHLSNARPVPLTLTGGLLRLVEPLGIHVSSCVSVWTGGNGRTTLCRRLLSTSDSAAQRHLRSHNSPD